MKCLGKIKVTAYLALFVFVSIVLAQETHNLEIIWQKAGDTTFLSYGFLPTTSGDVNGDGYDDILYYGNERSWAGRAFLFYGGDNLDTIPDAIFSNSNGYNSVCMGDFNGDKYDDVALGNQNGPDGYGRVYIYLGGNPIDTICDFQMRGPQGGSLFGQAISAGDVNGDSFSDLIVGAYGAAPRPGAFDMGQVYIYYGGPNFDTIPDVILNGGHNGDYEGFGSDIGRCVDVNSDGYEDAIIGAWDYGSSQGRLYIYFGGNPMDTVYDVAMIGEGSGQHLGWDAVSSLKNIANFDYALVGTSLWPRGFPAVSRGKIYILFGGNPMDSIPDIWMIGKQDSSGLANSLSYAGNITQNFSEAIVAGAVYEPGDYTGTAYIWQGEPNLDTIPDAWMKGTVPDQGIGWNVASAGDVNGDGKDEIMVSNYATIQMPKRVWICKYTGQGIEERQTQNAEHLPLEVKPNPAKSQTAIRFSLSAESKVTLKVYDITGKLVKTLRADTRMVKAENYEIRWNLRDDNQKKVATGIYFIEINAGDRVSERKKITVVK
jgi:hypothetical protein